MEEEIRAQLPPGSADELLAVVAVLAEGAASVLGSDLVGVYLTGSFALGAADVRSDVDFLVVSRHELTPGREASARKLHRALPDRAEHWAQHLEGSWVSAAALRDPAGTHHPWLYVDNGSRVMEHSRHDDTVNARWVFRAGAIPAIGPGPATLLDEVDADALRREAVEQAEIRSGWLHDHPETHHDGWAQPYFVLLFCRLIYSAKYGQVGSKNASASWVRDVVAPRDFAGLLSDAIAHRAAPYDPASGNSDPTRAAQSPIFIAWAVEEIQRRAAAAAR